MSQEARFWRLNITPFGKIQTFLIAIMSRYLNPNDHTLAKKTIQPNAPHTFEAEPWTNPARAGARMQRLTALASINLNIIVKESRRRIRPL